MSCFLKLQDVCISLDEKVLFEKLDLHVSHKEKVAIIGENGCGKTTLLETIAGLHTKQSGLFELFHTPIQEKKDYKPLRDLVGYLFQDSNDQFLAPIVEDDIAFSLLARSLSKLEAKKRVDMILEDFGIEHLRKKVVYNLSGGKKSL